MISNRFQPSLGVVLRRSMICRKANGELEAEISGKGMDFKTVKGNQ